MNKKEQALFDYLLFLGDSGLILGQRLGEWCGHGPYLEEDIALTNISLDLIGQARAFYTYAGEIEGRGRDEDKLAFFRNQEEFKNTLLTEEPNGDFGRTIIRQLLVSSFQKILFSELSNSSDEKLAALATKSLKEVSYHYRHAKEWTLRLGDGTELSHSKVQSALNEIWHLSGDMFVNTPEDQILIAEKIVPDFKTLKPGWFEQIKSDLDEATLVLPESTFELTGGRTGIHSEHLGHILSEMQSLARSLPNAVW